jgi:putative acetyltransferase
MSASAKPAVALRPFLPQDAALLAEIFRASVEELTADDYGVAEQEAWASAADDEAAFAQRLARALTLVAMLDGSVVGFISLDGEKIDMLYVHPAAVSQGVATALYAAVERLAASRGLKKLTADASDTAQEFFARRGFVPVQRQVVPLGGEWLANTVMEKKLSQEHAS